MSQENQQVTITVPKDVHAKMKARSAEEGLFIAEAYLSASRNWLDSMDGKGNGFKPTNAALHHDLEAIMNRRDAETNAAITALLHLLRRIEK